MLKMTKQPRRIPTNYNSLASFSRLMNLFIYKVRGDSEFQVYDCFLLKHVSHNQQEILMLENGKFFRMLGQIFNFVYSFLWLKSAILPILFCKFKISLFTF